MARDGAGETGNRSRTGGSCFIPVHVPGQVVAIVRIFTGVQDCFNVQRGQIVLYLQWFVVAFPPDQINSVPGLGRACSDRIHYAVIQRVTHRPELVRKDTPEFAIVCCPCLGHILQYEGLWLEGSNAHNTYFGSDASILGIHYSLLFS